MARSRKMAFFTAVSFLITLAVPALLLAADPVVAKANADHFKILTLIPPVVAIVLAFVTRNVVLSLFAGIFSGTFMLSLNEGVVSAFKGGFIKLNHEVLGALADPWNAGIVLQCLAIGGLIALVSKMGGAKAIAEALAKKATGATSAQMYAWFMGLLIFFDDYANSLTVGPIMRPVTDRMKISREKLAFIIDGTAAPIAGIALISTWVAYEIGLIKDGYAGLGIEANAYGIFVGTIPFRFYNILILIFIVATAVMLREFGPMLTAERRARTTGKVLADGAKPMAAAESTGLEPDESVSLNIWNAIIPIMTLIIGAFVGFYFNGRGAIMGGDDAALIQLLTDSPASFTAIREAFGASDASIVLFEAALFAGIVAIVLGVSQRIYTIEVAVDTWVQGVKSLVITGVILLLAWSLSSVIKQLGTAMYLVSVLSDSIPPFTLPAIIFVLGSFISFATGTSYGTMGILMPLAIPLAHAINPESGYMLMNIGAVLTGAIFGDHCSPISDTTILSSMGAACDHIDHTRTQLVYAVTVALVTVVFGYIPAGLGVPVYIILPVAAAALIGVLFFFGKPVEEA
ncbi:Na+/H+ antiporter NhaC family protein [Desulfoluna spongiiphila]|uniref:Transporter, NhaC family n=1 Tax=Desulfoluna spongiiphila TaxID=419481 RepID=A0A1G5B0N6_9BACT|nr:Na+/H+ antiporter NhaC family protein [Desulfoluna spongiiphila]SCX83636.1 transporter, NhaC family [Desulfoluna spongiiphila]VVS92115.1 na+/h+ antiporter nhac-like c-terminal [Desulfoluna spongiiphila]